MEYKYYEKPLFCCKSITLLNYLCKRFDVVRIADDKDNPKFKVFLFEDTEELRNYYKEFKTV